MNRSERRKQIAGVVNAVIKGRQQLVKKKQWGIGLVITTQVIAITFLRWTWLPWDRRLR